MKSVVILFCMFTLICQSSEKISVKDFLCEQPPEITLIILDQCFLLETDHAYTESRTNLYNISITNKRLASLAHRSYVHVIKKKMDQILNLTQPMIPSIPLANIVDSAGKPCDVFEAAEKMLSTPLLLQKNQEAIELAEIKRGYTVELKKNGTLFTLLLVHHDCPISVLHFCTLILGQRTKDAKHCDIRAHIGASKLNCPFTLEGLAILSLDIAKLEFIFKAGLADQSVALKNGATYPYHLLHLISQLIYNIKDLCQTEQRTSEITTKNLLNEHIVRINKMNDPLLIFITKSFKLLNDKNYPYNDSDINKMAYFMLSMLDIPEVHANFVYSNK